MAREPWPRERLLASGTPIDLMELMRRAEKRGGRDEEAERLLGLRMSRLRASRWLDVVSGRTATLGPDGAARLVRGRRGRRPIRT